MLKLGGRGCKDGVWLATSKGGRLKPNHSCWEAFLKDHMNHTTGAIYHVKISYMKFQLLKFHIGYFNMVMGRRVSPVLNSTETSANRDLKANLDMRAQHLKPERR